MGWLIVVMAISSLSWLFFFFLFLKKPRTINKKLMIILLFTVNAILFVLALIIHPEYGTATLIGFFSVILCFSLGIFVLEKSERDVERIVAEEKGIREDVTQPDQKDDV